MGTDVDFKEQSSATESSATRKAPRFSDSGERRGLPRGHLQGWVTALDRRLASKMMAFLGQPPVLLLLWDGEPVFRPAAEPVAAIRFHSRRALLKVVINPELYFGDFYAAGQITVDGDLVELARIVYANLDDSGRGGWLRRLIIKLQHRRIVNPQHKALDNIHHHYDIGNEFYRLWLDRAEMQYTCAYFPDPTMSLEAAQTEKLHHVCRKLELKPDDRVVEAGCGWGGLARFMARHYGVRVTAYNISKEQVTFAQQAAEGEGLADRVEYRLDDYRNIDGQFDKFVSVGMLEHVGTADYRKLGEVVKRCLKPDGRGLIHSIGRIRPGPMNAWIERRIFRGAYRPSLGEMAAIFEPSKLSVLDVENLRLHYALTLEHWLTRFTAHEDDVRRMLDEEFVRAWRLYLAGSIAAFRVGELQLYQVVFTHNRNNDIPWSREHVYGHRARRAAKKNEPA